MTTLQSAKMRVRRRIVIAGYWLHALRHGVDLFCDIRRILPSEQFLTVFDIGANVGQSAARYRREFPAAEIFSFEPDHRTFETLSRRVSKDRHVRPVELAFGALEGRRRFDNSAPESTLHRLAEDQERGELPWVTVTTVDAFCAERRISRIDFMKIDTEGHDLAVLQGSRRLLAESGISVIFVECSMNAENRFHVGLMEMHQFLEGVGYRMFGIYEQVPECRHAGKPYLHRANVAYLSPKISERNSPVLHY